MIRGCGRRKNELHRVQGRYMTRSNNALQQRLEPSVLFTSATSTAASSEGELGLRMPLVFDELLD